MSARILLVRHGRSAHAERGWLTAAGMTAWLATYDGAGLAPGEQPPVALRAAAATADYVVASDLPRAEASALLLAPEMPIVLSPLLREATMPVPPWTRVALPLVGWGLVIGARWMYGRQQGVLPLPLERRQARSAAEWLTDLAEPDRFVLAVTHATVRGMIARALVAAGWVREAAASQRTARDYAHWSAWSMVRRAAP